MVYFSLKKSPLCNLKNAFDTFDHSLYLLHKLYKSFFSFLFLYCSHIFTENKTLKTVLFQFNVIKDNQNIRILIIVFHSTHLLQYTFIYLSFLNELVTEHY